MRGVKILRNNFYVNIVSMRPKTFVYTFIKSIFNLQYYNDIMKAKVSFSIRYYLMLTLLLSLGYAVVTTTNTGPVVIEKYYEVRNEALKYYPDDLSIIGEDGVVTTNQGDPYFFPLPKEIELGDGEMLKNAIVFSKQGTIEDIFNYESFALVNSKNIIYRSSPGTNNKLEIEPTKNLGNFTFTKADLEKAAQYVDTYIKYTYAIIGVSVFIAFALFMLLWIMTGNVILSAIMTVASKLMNKKLPFEKAFQIALHTATLPLIVGALIDAFGIWMPISFWFSGLHFLLALIIILNLKEEAQTSPAQA